MEIKFAGDDGTIPEAVIRALEGYWVTLTDVEGYEIDAEIHTVGGRLISFRPISGTSLGPRLTIDLDSVRKVEVL